MKNITKEVLLNALAAGLLASGAVVLKAALGSNVKIDMDMNEVCDKAAGGTLLENDAILAG